MTTQISASSDTRPTPAQIKSVREYIKDSWVTLRRSHDHLLDSAKDEKLAHKPGDPWIVYISPREDCPEVQQVLEKSLSKEDLKQISILRLPAEPEAIRKHGLLYLPGDYVVPGGRFNEMYGWDSYFIVLGLLRDGEVDLAQSLVDQALYQVGHYGTILNSNRTYMLQRSQPPVLSLMVLAVYEVTQDRDWLSSAVPLLEQFYYFWVVPPHLNPGTGLSRYYALGDGPSPEVLFSERDEEGRNHYDRVKTYYQTFSFDDYDMSLYYDEEANELTALFYKGDRSMRESGFDITNRFGPFSIDILHYAPVCLNSLLYGMERDMAKIRRIMGKEELAQQWEDRAVERQGRADRYLWDDEAGLYFDYNLQTSRRRHYEFAATFYPLWLGMSSPEQARRVADNLDRFEAPGGILASTYVTGNQWDAPFGWAPLNWIAVEGLRRYGHYEASERIARKFLTMVIDEFEKRGTLLEKYDVMRRSGNVSDEIRFGYSSNEIGFGWTNAVVLEFLDVLAEKADQTAA